MKKISDIKLSELREFCKAYQIDHTLAMKFQHDLRYGTLEDETLNYIWSDSKGLRETLMKLVKCLKHVYMNIWKMERL